MNLFNNAIDAMGSGGGVLEIRSKVEGDWVWSMLCHGHGISKAVRRACSDPFFRRSGGQGNGPRAFPSVMEFLELGEKSRSAVRWKWYDFSRISAAAGLECLMRH